MTGKTADEDGTEEKIRYANLTIEGDKTERFPTRVAVGHRSEILLVFL